MDTTVLVGRITGVACVFLVVIPGVRVCALGSSGFVGSTAEAIPPSYSFSTSTGSQNVSGSELVIKCRQLSIGVFRDKSLSTYYIRIWLYWLISGVQCPVHLFLVGKYFELHLPNMILGGVQEKLPDVPRGFRKNYLRGEGNDLNSYYVFSECLKKTGVIPQ